MLREAGPGDGEHWMLREARPKRRRRWEQLAQRVRLGLRWRKRKKMIRVQYSVVAANINLREFLPASCFSMLDGLRPASKVQKMYQEA
jgi:hypothetical protein